VRQWRDLALLAHAIEANQLQLMSTQPVMRLPQLSNFEFSYKTEPSGVFVYGLVYAIYIA
jgi:hypothetical protein